MKLRVTVGARAQVVTCRTGEKHITRAIMGAVLEAGEMRRLSPHALEAGRAIRAGLGGYHWAGPPAFSVETVD